MTDCVFDPVEHIYLIDGRQVESITQITGQFIDSSWFDQYDADKGTEVHGMIHVWIMGEAVNKSFADPGYLEAYKKFYYEKSVTVLLSEKPLFNIKEGWAGTADQYAIVENIPSVVEIKTGPDHPAHHLQTAAQAELVRINKIGTAKQRMVLQLNKDGTYKIHVHKDHSDLGMFKSALWIYRWKQRHNLK